MSPFIYVLVFATGFLTKITDNLSDERFDFNQSVKYLTGLLYGLSVGFLLTVDSALAAVIIAITVGNLLFGRIGQKAHQVAFAGIFLMVAAFGVPKVNLPVLAALFFFAWLDEFLNEKSDRIGKAKAAGWFLRYRLTLKIAALAVSVLTSNPVYFISVLLFDVAYHLTDEVMHRKIGKVETKYGNHLVFDFYRCRSKTLGSKEFMRKTLMDLVKILGMRAISRPFVMEYKGSKEKKDSGISGFVLIAESHISIHTYPERCLAKIDVVSCREIEKEKVFAYLKKHFRPEDCRYECLGRGKEYPHDIRKAKELVLKERS